MYFKISSYKEVQCSKMSKRRRAATLKGEGGGLPHQVGHDQSGGSAPASSAVDQSPPCLVLVDPFSHWVKVVCQGP